MPNFSGIWTSRQQMQARGADIWPAAPGAPTSVSATAGTALNATVTFTAPADAGYPATITGYTVTSSPGGITATGSTSPIAVTGLTDGVTYTFTVTATNATGTGPASAASNSIVAETIIAPEFIVTISNGGTLAFTYNVATNTLTNVSSTYVPSGSPASAGGYEGVATNGQGTKVISTGWTSPLICATFNLASTPWARTSQSNLPNGGGGNSLGGSPSVNSRGTYVVVSSSTGVYYSSATGNSWTNMSIAGGYLRTAAGHNRFYVANGNTDLRCYAGTSTPSYISSINCGSSDRMSASERTYNPNGYTNPPTNEIIVVSGATSAIVLYTASTNTYSVLRQGSVSDGLPTTYGAGVTRDGTRAVFASGSRAYIYDIDPDAGTASLLTDFAIAYGVGYGGGVDIFPSGNMIAVMNTGTMGIYDLSGTLKTTISAGTYGLTCVYDGVNAV